MNALPLGELYERACVALGAAPQPEIARALNLGDDAAAELSRLIVTAANDPRVGSSERGIRPPRNHGNGIPALPDVDLCLHTIASAGSAAGAAARVRAILRPHAVAAAARQSRRRAAVRSVNLDSASFLANQCKSPEESCSRLTACVALGTAQARDAAGKHAIVILGNTGAGKSCFVNLMQGCKFALHNDRTVVRPDSPVSELMKIGHTNKSETLAPAIAACSDVFGLKGFAFVDCPGFLDNRGFEINIANAVNIKRTMAAASTARVVVIINYHSLMADRGKGVKDLFSILSGIFGSVASVQRHAKSFLLAISQAPLTHPDTGCAMTLTQHRSRLLDPSGLDDTAAALLGAIGKENVFCFHLLEEERSAIMHGSWLRRRGIADRIKALAPIVTSMSPKVEQNELIFQSAVDDHDKESLRGMVGGIGTHVQAALSLGAFDMAVDLVHDLIRLERTVGDRFVTALVAGCVRSAVLGEAEEGSEEEGDEDKDKGSLYPSAIQLENARRKLQRIAARMIAFAGVEHLCKELMASLFQGVAALEAVVQDAEEAAGQHTARAHLGVVVREAGDNVVKEVLLLRKEENKMCAQLSEQTQQLAHAIEQHTTAAHRGDSESTDQALCFQAISRARHYAYRVRAAQAHWRQHCEQAKCRLAAHDQQLRESGAAAFWAKVGSSPEQLREYDGETPLDWNRKSIYPSDCEVVGAEFRSGEGLLSTSVKRLFLSGNSIGDSGLTAMVAHASAFGALPNLQRLHAQQNGIGNAGFTNLAKAFRDGQLRFLTLLDLGRNSIGCDGIKAFAAVLDSSVLRHLATLYLSSNEIGTEGAVAFANALSGRVLAKLKILWLNRNRIGDEGVAAFHAAVHKGGLVSCQQLMFQMNPAQLSMQKAVLETLRERSASSSLRVPEKADQYASMRGL